MGRPSALFCFHFACDAADDDAPVASGDPAACEALILERASAGLSETMRRVLRLSLAARKHSPRVELFRSLVPAQPAPPDGACCWVHVAGGAPEGRVISAPSELPAALDATAALGAQGADVPHALTLHPLDHVHPASAASAPAAVLYAPLGAACFPPLHAALSAAAASGAARYALRPAPPGAACASPGCAAARVGMGRNPSPEAPPEPLPLGGFGVEMALKNMEYKAIDDSAKKAADAAGAGNDAAAAGDDLAAADADVRGFVFSRLVARRPELSAELATFRDALLSASSADDGASLKVWDMKDLGVQAAQRIAAASDPLRLLQDVAHAFPALATSLSRMRINASFAAELDTNQRRVRGGATVLTLNGAPLDTERTDLFSLIDAVSAEVRFGASLASLSLPPEAVRALSRLQEPRAEPLRLNTSGAPVVWANDIESDEAAARWPRSLRALLQLRYPGRLPAVRRNLFNAIFVMDPASEAALVAAEAAAYYIQSAVSVRFGLVPCVGCAAPAKQDAEDDGDADDDAYETEAEAAEAASVDPALSRQVARLFLAVSDAHGDAVAWQWLAAASSARRLVDEERQQREPLTWRTATNALTKLMRGRDPAGATAASALVTLAAAPNAATPESGALAARVEAGAAWAKSRGMARAPLLLMNGMAFTRRDTGGQTLDYVAVLLANQESQTLAEAVYFGKLSDADDVQEWLLRSAVPTYNAAIASPREPPARLRLSGSTFWGAAAPTAALRYMYVPGAEDSVAHISHWVAADAGTAAGRAVIAAAASALAGDASLPPSKARVAFLHAGDASGMPHLLARVLQASMELPSRRAKLAPFLAALFADADAAAAADAGDEAALLQRVVSLADASGLRGEALAAAARTIGTDVLTSQAALVRSGALSDGAAAAVAGGGAAVVTNGRVTVLKPAAALALRAGDFVLLEALELRDSASAVAPIVEAAALTSVGSDPDEEQPAERFSTAISAAASVVAARHAAAAAAAGGARHGGGGGDLLSGASLAHTAIVTAPPTAVISVEGFLDPLSADAQRVAPLLLLMREALGDALSVRIALNPGRELTDLPLKTYYRYAAPQLATPLVGAPPPGAHFTGLPPSRTLTLGAHVPDAWLIRAVDAPYDLDNLRLEDLGAARGFSAAFELEHLLVTGHASEVGSRSPPRGMQLTLTATPPSLAPPVGTIVMSNLGYFQLKAAPGIHTLAIAPGRSRQLYALAADGVGDAFARTASLQVAPLPPAPADEGLPSAVAIAVGDFSGRTLRLRLMKRPGMEHADVLAPLRDGDGDSDDSDKSGSLWVRAKGWLGAGGSASASAGDNALATAGEDNSKIHIFSVASGHLYERFLKIMVLSVLRHTRTPVKFWFIKNYASPGCARFDLHPPLSPRFWSRVAARRFADFLPAFAAHYGFEYELITYKWPTWLNKQTEKQRIIWAYKVLFLDVLFPLSLKKVSFPLPLPLCPAALMRLPCLLVGHFRGCGPDRAHRHENAHGHGPARRAARLHAHVRQRARDGGLPLLEAGLLEGSPAWQAVPHQRAVRRGPRGLPRRGGGRPVPHPVRVAQQGPWQPG